MQLFGRLTADSVVRNTKNGKQVVGFDVAINDSYRPAGGGDPVKLTTYVQCSYWRQSGIAQYLTKGTLVELSGRVGVNAYVSQQGEPKASLTFHVNEIKLHGGSRSSSTRTTTANSGVTVVAGELTEPLEDLPF